MRFNPLTGRIQPSFFLAADGGESGAAVMDPPAKPETSSFATEMAEKLRGAQEEAEREKAPTDPKPEPEKPAEAKAPEKKPEVKKPSIPGLPNEVFSTEEENKPDPAEDDLDTAELTRNLSSKGRENFLRLESSYKGKLTAAQTELQTAKARLLELESEVSSGLKADAAKALQAEHEKLKAEHAKMLETVELIGVERHPKFQEKFVAGRAALVEGASDIVLRAGGNVEEFRRALQLEGRARYDAMRDAMDGAPEFLMVQVGATVNSIEKLDKEREKTIAKGRDNLGQWAEQETAKQREESQKVQVAREQLFDQQLGPLSKEVLFLRKIPEGAEGAEQWNKTVEEVIEGGKNLLLKNANFNDFAAAAVKSHAYDRLQPMFMEMRAKYLEAMEQIASMTSAEPGGSSGAGGGNGGAVGSGDENLSWSERVHKGIALGQQSQ